MEREGRPTRTFRTQATILWQIPEISFCPIYLRLGAKGPGNPETSIGTDNKSPNKSRLLLAKGQRGSITKRKCLDSDNSPLAKQHGKTCSPSPTFTSKSQVGSLDFQAAEVTRPPNLIQWFHTRLRREPGFSSLPENNEAILSS